jgi:hypothetical protein
LNHELTNGIPGGVAADAVRAQIDRLSKDPALASSKRSVAFLNYVVNETLRGAADSIKERTIGVEVYGRAPTYDTNLDHVVRTAGLELRKRLSIYYGNPQHGDELRVSLVPGSYIPQFAWPRDPGLIQPLTEEVLKQPDASRVLMAAADQSPKWRMRVRGGVAVVVLVLLVIASASWLRRSRNAERPDALGLFWAPLTNAPDPILIAVGTARDGLPKAALRVDGETLVIPGPAEPRYIPYADAVATAQVAGELKAIGKAVRIRRAMDTTFSDLRQTPVVLIGAFDNPWSLRLMEGLRYSTEVDDKAHEVYIRDAKAPSSRVWRWRNEPSNKLDGANGSPVLHDYALISRIRESRTGRVVVLIAGLEPYGTEAAGEFATDAVQLSILAKTISLSDSRNLQIVLETTVTDGTPGTPHIVAISQE